MDVNAEVGFQKGTFCIVKGYLLRANRYPFATSESTFLIASSHILFPDTLIGAGKMAFLSCHKVYRTTNFSPFTT